MLVKVVLQMQGSSRVLREIVINIMITYIDLFTFLPLITTTSFKKASLLLSF